MDSRHDKRRVRPGRPLCGDDLSRDARQIRAERGHPAGGHRLRQHPLPALVRKQRRSHEPAQRHCAAGLVASRVQQVPHGHRLPDRGRLLRADLAWLPAARLGARERLRPPDELRRWRVRRAVRWRNVRRGVLRDGPREDRRGRACVHTLRIALRADGAGHAQVVPQRPQGLEARLEMRKGQVAREP